MKSLFAVCAIALVAWNAKADYDASQLWSRLGGIEKITRVISLPPSPKNIYAWAVFSNFFCFACSCCVVLVGRRNCPYARNWPSYKGLVWSWKVSKCRSSRCRRKLGWLCIYSCCAFDETQDETSLHTTASCMYMGLHAFTYHRPAQYTPTQLHCQVLTFFSTAFGPEEIKKKYAYKGKSMAEAHKGMKLPDHAFHALAGHLITQLKVQDLGGVEEREFLLNVLKSVWQDDIKPNTHAEVNSTEFIPFEAGAGPHWDTPTTPENVWNRLGGLEKISKVRVCFEKWTASVMSAKCNASFLVF